MTATIYGTAEFDSHAAHATKTVRYTAADGADAIHIKCPHGELTWHKGVSYVADGRGGWVGSATHGSFVAADEVYGEVTDITYPTMTVDGGYGSSFTAATTDAAIALAEAAGYKVLDVMDDTLVIAP